MIGWFAFAGLVLTILAVLTSPRARAWLASRGHPQLAADLEIANELVHVAIAAADDLSHGKPPLEALASAEKSPEAHALFERILQKVRSS